MNTVVLWVATGQADGVLSLLHRDMLRPVVDRALDSVVPLHKVDAIYGKGTWLTISNCLDAIQRIG